MAEQREHIGDAPEKIGRVTDEDVTDVADDEFEDDEDADEDMDEDDAETAE